MQNFLKLSSWHKTWMYPMIVNFLNWKKRFCLLPLNWVHLIMHCGVGWHHCNIKLLQRIATTPERKSPTPNYFINLFRIGGLPSRAAQYQCFPIDSISIIQFVFLSIPISISIILKRAYQYQYFINYSKNSLINFNINTS